MNGTMAEGGCQAIPDWMIAQFRDDPAFRRGMEATEPELFAELSQMGQIAEAAATNVAPVASDLKVAKIGQIEPVANAKPSLEERVAGKTRKPRAKPPEPVERRRANTQSGQGWPEWTRELSRCKELSLLAFKVGTAIYEHRSYAKGTSWCLIPTLCADVGRSEKPVKTARAELADRGWITVHYKRGKTIIWNFTIPKCPCGAHGSIDATPTHSSGDQQGN